MKKIVALLILIILALCIFCWNQRSQISQFKQSIEPPEKETAKQQQILEFGQDKNFADIDYDNAKKLVKEFVRTNVKSNWYVYFTKDDLKGIQSLVTASANYGIKVYFGRYYNDAELIKYIKPLFENDDNKVRDFLRDYSNNTTAIFAQVTDESGNINTNTLRNLGGLCPPSCKPPSDVSVDPLAKLK